MSTIYDRELLAQALEALEEINKLSIGKNAISLPAEIDTAMDALRERLERPELEPVAWGVFEENLRDMFFTQEEAQEIWSRCVEAVESKLKEKNGD